MVYTLLDHINDTIEYRDISYRSCWWRVLYWVTNDDDASLVFHKLTAKHGHIANPFFLPLIRSLVRSLVCSFVRSFVHSFIHSFIHSFRRSFFRSFVQNYRFEVQFTREYIFHSVTTKVVLKQLMPGYHERSRLKCSRQGCRRQSMSIWSSWTHTGNLYHGRADESKHRSDLVSK